MTLKMIKKPLIITLILLVVVFSIEAKRMSRGRSSGSGRGSSRRTNYKPQPSPASLSYPQPSAPKQSLFGWQEKSAHKTPTSSRQSKPSNSHSYPSSQTGLSGNGPGRQSPSYPSSGGLSGNPNYQSGQTSGKQTNYQESVQRGNVPQNYPNQNRASNNNHGYPSSGGLSGNGHNKPGQTSQNGNGYQSHSISSNNQNPAGGSSMNNYGNNQHYPPGPPPPYSNAPNSGYGSYGGFGSYGGHGYYNPSYGPQMPGYFGNYGMPGKSYGGLSRTGSALTGVGIAGAGLGTIMTGLALWNLARSTGKHHHTVIYDNRGQPVAVAPDNSTMPDVDPILKDLVNCTLTISNGKSKELLEIPCSIATSFTPEADVKTTLSDKNENDGTECTVTVVTKSGKEFMTTIPCSTLLKTAEENNVTEPPFNANATEVNTFVMNETIVNSVTVSPSDISMNCSVQPLDIQDPINPCFSVTQNLTVIALMTANSTSHQNFTDHIN